MYDVLASPLGPWMIQSSPLLLDNCVILMDNDGFISPADISALNASGRGWKRGRLHVGRVYHCLPKLGLFMSYSRSWVTEHSFIQKNLLRELVEGRIEIIGYCRLQAEGGPGFEFRFLVGRFTLLNGCTHPMTGYKYHSFSDKSAQGHNFTMNSGRAVLATVVGPLPYDENGRPKTVQHDNGRGNNAIDSLRWLSYSEQNLAENKRYG